MNLSELHFDNSFVNTFPGDEGENISRQTPKVLFSKVLPTPVAKPEILIWSDDAARLLGLTAPKENTNENTSEEAQVFSGNQLLKGMSPFASRYGGHQFGHWAGQLGDGRAISLGEVINPDGKRYEIQLKGAGSTPYSRNADGRAVLRSSLREFLCSEAMYYLRVPTTRALCCVTTGDLVMRDMFYNGNAELEPGAITTRLAPTFLRFGHFQILAVNNEIELLKKLIKYTIDNHFPGFSANSDEEIAQWFTEICKRTAKLMIEWSRVGFVHGVMNTDNMSILGLTIDYGPYGFLDVYEPDWTPNTTDAQQKRYRFEAQPDVALWNLLQLAESLLVVVADAEKLERGLNTYREIFQSEYSQMMANKLGLKKLAGSNDTRLLQELNSILQLEEIDMTIFYHNLSRVYSMSDFDIIKQAYYAQSPAAASLAPMRDWLERYLV